MELKCTNPNSEIVLEKKQKHVGLLVLKNYKISFKNETYKIFFQEDAKIAQKTRLSIIFS